MQRRKHPGWLSAIKWAIPAATALDLLVAVIAFSKGQAEPAFALSIVATVVLVGCLCASLGFGGLRR